MIAKIHRKGLTYQQSNFPKLILLHIDSVGLSGFEKAIKSRKILIYVCPSDKSIICCQGGQFNPQQGERGWIQILVDLRAKKGRL